MQVMGGLVEGREGLWGLAWHPGFQGLACHAMAGRHLAGLQSPSGCQS